MGADTAENLKRTFKGLFAFIDIGKQVFGALLSAFASVIKFMFPVTSSFLSVTGSVGDFIVAIDEALKSSNAFTNVIKKIGQTIAPLANGIRLAVTSLLDALSQLAVVDMSGFGRVC